MEHAPRKQILILGGGFAGLTVAMELEKKLAQDPSIEITLISRENFFLFTPMLHEVAASDLDLDDDCESCPQDASACSLFCGRGLSD